MGTQNFTEYVNRSLNETNAVYHSIYGVDEFELQALETSESWTSLDGLITESIYRHCESGETFQITITQLDGGEVVQHERNKKGI